MGRNFIVRTDHNSLRWLLNFKDAQGQLARWLEVLSQYNMNIHHRKGSKHVNADILSRYQIRSPCREMSIHVKLEDLPCKGCKHCATVHRSWEVFAKEIDNIVPLGQTVVSQCTLSDFDRTITDRKMVSENTQLLERLQKEADCLEQKIEGLVGRKLAGNGKTLTDEDNDVSSQIQLLASQLQELIVDLRGTLEQFAGSLYTQMNELWKQWKTAVNKEVGRRLRNEQKRRKRQYKKTFLEVITEIDQEESQPQGTRRFDPQKKPVLDPTAMSCLFEMPGVEEDDTVDDPDTYIEISRGKYVNMITTRRELKPVDELHSVDENETKPDDTKGLLEDEVDVEAVFPGYTFQEIKSAQEEDEELHLILSFLAKKEEPPESLKALGSPAAKKYLVNREFFYLNREGVLYNISKNQVHRLVVPRKYVEEVTSLNHDLVCTGHQGIQRTLERIKAKFYWFRMNEFIKDFVKTCNVCNHYKKLTRKAKAPMTRYHAGSAMERVHLDFLGPLPETPRGHNNILVMVDQFTKWCEIVPLPSQTAEVTAKAAVDQFFARFGCPFVVHTDQGRNFESKLFKAICDLLKIHKTRTTPYRPSANGQVERYNRTLMDAVRCFVSESQEDWDEYLPQLACALRSSVNRHTGMTPNQMMLGREINLPADLMFKPVTTEKFDTEAEYVQKLRQKMRTAHEVARKTLQTAQETMKRDYDLNMRQFEYRPGDLVYLLDTAKVPGRAKKLDPPWKGPAIVVERISMYIYRVKQKNSTVITNHDRMKRCNDRHIPKWLTDLQQRLLTGEQIADVKIEATYCLCEQPDNGEFMIGCDRCSEWYHGQCVQITPEMAENIQTYICPRCQTPQLHPRM